MAVSEPKPDTIKRAARIERTRRESLGLSQDMKEQGGPSRAVITELELKNVWPKRPATQMQIAHALRWRPDAFELLAKGKDPVELEGVTTEELRSLVSSARMILEELERRLEQ